MNAAEQANSVEVATKIAALVNLFKTELPDIRSDLKPWANDPDTRELVDPDSIDVGFHFPGWSRKWQSRSILIQVRLHPDDSDETEADLPDASGASDDAPGHDRAGPGSASGDRAKKENSGKGRRNSGPPRRRRAIGIEAAGFDHRGKQWTLSTVETWTAAGANCPTPEMQDKLRMVLKQAMVLFNPS
jgi:hypothetical protein